MASGSLALAFKIRPWFINQSPLLIQNFKANNLSNLPIIKRGVPFQTPIFTMEEKIQICLLGNVFIVAKIITLKKIIEFFWQMKQIRYCILTTLIKNKCFT
jgi:hypothetical protein